MNKAGGYRCDPSTGLVYGKLEDRVIGRVDGRGYVRISSRTKYIQAHRLIWESVYGPIPTGMQINHINGIKTDNRIANLELVTSGENTAHAYRIGLISAKGECNGRAKLTESQVADIRSELGSGASKSAIARKYGMSRSAIRDIASNRNWTISACNGVRA